MWLDPTESVPFKENPSPRTISLSQPTQISQVDILDVVPQKLSPTPTAGRNCCSGNFFSSADLHLCQSSAWASLPSTLGRSNQYISWMGRIYNFCSLFWISTFKSDRSLQTACNVLQYVSPVFFKVKTIHCSLWSELSGVMLHPWPARRFPLHPCPTTERAGNLAYTTLFLRQPSYLRWFISQAWRSLAIEILF